MSVRSTIETPLFSVIVTTYGRPDLLEHALRSVAAQTVEDLECIVVDDAGPIPVRLPSDRRFRLVRRDVNGGLAAARNTGLQEARGRFVTFLDDDDTFLPDRLEIALEGLEGAPIAICWSCYMDERASGGRVLEGDVSSTILDHITPHTGATALRREVALRFDERFIASQDVEWWLRLAEAEQVTTVRRVGHLIRRHPGVRHGNGLEERVRCGLMLLDLHREYFKRHPGAASFRWRRIGIISAGLGDHKLARLALSRSFRSRPRPITLWHLARSVRPSAGSLDLGPQGTVLSNGSFRRRVGSAPLERSTRD